MKTPTKKEEIRQAIKDLEPNNETAADMRAGREPLEKELKAAKRRKAQAEADDAIPVEARYHLEGEEKMSWKYYSRQTHKPVSTLKYGFEIPLVGTIVPADDDGSPFIIKSHVAGELPIVAGDLAVREQFDPRRIYTTPNGTTVVFKRVDKATGKTVLWSYKVNAEILSGNIPLEKTERTAKPVAQSNRKMTQKVLAAYLIGNNPTITGGELSEQLQTAFPGNRIGPRHGPHYLSLSRSGRLPEVPDSDPRTW